MNETARRTLEEVRAERRRRGLLTDWRYPAALAAVLFVLSSLIGLFTITRQRDAQNEVTSALLVQVDRLEERAASAEERAATAARLSEDNARLLENNARLLEEVRGLATDVDRIVAADAEREAQRGPLVEAAIRRIIAGIEDGNADVVVALNEIRALVGANSEVLVRLDRLIAEAEAEAREDGRPTAAEQEAAPPTTTTTAPPPPPPPPPEWADKPGVIRADELGG